MRLIALTLGIALAIHQMLVVSVASTPAQGASLPAALAEMAETERAFVRLSQTVGWKQAFLDYFADTAVGFASGQPGPAKDEIRKQPDPPKDLEFWWEPRFGDIAASGELGWLTGPVRQRHPARNGGKPRYSTYSSIWKRHADGQFKVVIDLGIQTPGEPAFPPGMTRAPLWDRFTAAQTGPLAEASLLAADRALIAAARTSLGDAYARALAPAARVHRNGHMPFEGKDPALVWLKTQPPLIAGDAAYGEVARSADLGYTWGTFASAPGADGKAESGFYARVWVREGSGAWRVSLDVTAARAPRSAIGVNRDRRQPCTIG